MPNFINSKIHLGAHYYLWWGRPILPVLGAGDWKRSNYTHQPLLGEYDSRNPEVISRHIQWAQDAGIDFFIVNWQDAGSWDDITLRDHYLVHPASSKTQFCIHYDSIPALNRYRFNIYPSYDFETEYSPLKTKGEKFVEDFEYLAENYFNHPQYLRINNQPVVVVYNVSAFRNIAKYFQELQANMRKRGIILFLVADVVCWGGVKISPKHFSLLWKTPPEEIIKIFYRALRRLSPKNYESDFSLTDYFKAITGYNLYSVNRAPNFLSDIERLYKKYREYAESSNLSFIPTIIPGYDDRKLNGLNRPVLERQNGKFYQKFWEIAKRYLDPSVKMVFLTSFNEWHEGTELEPSREFGREYLEITKNNISNVP